MTSIPGCWMGRVSAEALRVVAQITNLRYPICLLIMAVLAATTSAWADGSRTLVGAIRWDGWFHGNQWEHRLSPHYLHYRLPFYGREISAAEVEIRGDSQETMDQEIAYASAAGLDYWAFCWYQPEAWAKADAYNYGVRLYLSSRHRAALGFCLILLGRCVGPKGKWPATVDSLVKLFKEPTYQRVLDGRPLVYTYQLAEEMSKDFGSEEEGRAALDLLRRRSIEAGLKPPYLVTQVWDAKAGARYVDTLGFDAISGYAWYDFRQEHREYRYAALAKSNQGFWGTCKATGKQVIPLVSTGWDNRTWTEDKQPWYAQPTPREIADNLRAAIEWNRKNPSHAEANAILIYAWNETGEGGWLVPTKAEGTARLDAIRAVLRP